MKRGARGFLAGTEGIASWVTRKLARFARADAAFALPALYEALERREES